jgi:YfiH family protein
LVYYQFDGWAGRAHVAHGVFTRLGGRSQPPWHSLNTGHTVGDDLQAVEANHELICRALGCARGDLVSPHQVHGSRVRVVDERDKGGVLSETDALITATPGVMLMLRFADCVPVLFYDPVRRAVGLAHAGWRGTVAGIARVTVQAMVDELGCRPPDILAGIGPAIGPCCYEVGRDVADAVGQAMPAARLPDAGHLLSAEADTRVEGTAPRRPDGRGGDADRRWHLDLWAANRLQLVQAGVPCVDVAGLCTACHTDEWFSHRAERGRTGRLGALIGLRG